ncbi:ABC transporter ATP-binding protein [Fictibacillus barbaricus]|uniref:ATP-binding cassette subfamily C protein n=1 Tax=Fictibacillus barbaricus TaxID=182136 RepID=A0ABU1U1T3_9BACL|nr:ABC transporter ATP-binding protein [Fictibacillus barbaricus]MDR7073378.1 ATP-binding cassette subfamily C protein [Fictibacillus barbaricus]
MSSLIFFAKQLYQFAGKSLFINLFGMIVVSLLEGIGLLLLLPMLHLSNLMNVKESTIFSGLSSIFNGVPELYGLLMIFGVYIFLVVGHSLLKRNLTLRNVEILVRFVNQIRLVTYKGLLEANWLFLMRRRKSDFINALTDDLNRVANGTNLLFQLFTSVIFTFVQLIIAFLLSAKITLFVLIAGCILAYFSKQTLKSSKILGMQKSDLAKQYIGGLTDNFNGIKDIKSNHLENSSYIWLKNWSERFEQEQSEFSKLINNSQVLYKIISALLIAGLIFLSIVMFKAQPGQLLLIILIFSRLWPKLIAIQNNLQQLATNIPSIHSILQLQEESKSSIELGDASRDTSLPSISLQQKIECKHMYFKYDYSSESALQDINFVIKVNEMTAIIGRSGAGKSTLIDILMGLLQPEKGGLIVDGLPITKENLLSLRKATGYVPQEPFLFNGTIRDNLILVHPQATDDEIWEALNFSAADFVKKLPKGIDTYIGDRGVRLSGGERQRIVLARAILKKPSILILDEATSALDSENEAKIQEALEQLKGKMTIIVIAHRLSTISNADQIIVLEEGRIIQNGAFQKLADEKQKTFSDLLEKQMVLSKS